MTWHCAAIDHGVSIFSNGDIRPCCMVDHTYKKNIADIGNDPFADLRTGQAPDVCSRCTDVESRGMPSYRDHHNRLKTNAPGIQFLDIRNSNVCNLRCRTCCPDNSNQWAAEINALPLIRHTDLSKYKDVLITPSLTQIYYTGGEPLINAEHWTLLEELIALGYSKNISLMYNTNLTTLKFKNKNIFEVWAEFPSVMLNVSVDAIGEKFEYIRSGANWDTMSKNLDKLMKIISESKNIQAVIACTVSVLNIWFLDEVIEYFRGKLRVNLNDLEYPDYYALNAIPDSLKGLAHECVNKLELSGVDKKRCDVYRYQIENNNNRDFFRDAVTNIFLYDSIRGEKLFDMLPFRDAILELMTHEQK